MSLMGFKLLVTTTYFASSNITGTLSGHANVTGGLTTEVVEFPTLEATEDAFEALVGQELSGGLRRIVTRLYQ